MSSKFKTRSISPDLKAVASTGALSMRPINSRDWPALFEVVSLLIVLDRLKCDMDARRMRTFSWAELSYIGGNGFEAAILQITNNFNKWEIK